MICSNSGKHKNVVVDVLRWSFFACLSPDGSIKSKHADVVVDVEAVVVLVEPDLGHGEGLLEHGKLRKFSLWPA